MGHAALQTTLRSAGVLSIYTADPPGIGACAPYSAAGGPAGMAPVEQGSLRPQSAPRSCRDRPRTHPGLGVRDGGCGETALGEAEAVETGDR